MTRADLLREARRRLTVARIDNASLDARLLLVHALRIDALDLVRAPEAPVDVAAVKALDTLVARRIAGEPVARILGVKEFFGLPFHLSPDTLVPRPETELVVEEALRLWPEDDRPGAILDLGTGSGCILLAFLRQRMAARGVGIDRSIRAARTAQANARMLGLADQAHVVVGDWAAAIEARFDLVVSNPPYVRTGDIPALAREVARHDPRLALDGGEDGLTAYRAIFASLDRLLTPDGAAIVEIGYDQAEPVSALARELNLGAEILRDLAGHDRVAVIRR
ncbi:MAG: protein-(glutamine-N5) methyltransferase, release factor-specific [Rhizobiales bacterium 65-9]|nr:peptide chain release factor N(5)-glutamine methyltransferase [Hyphomicrobiales bacterium]OJY32858.1 MAG: protein-(glutamine-N5) methyltransferase, release factor-specific [Rhizobiales bacterium 65-9]